MVKITCSVLSIADWIMTRVRFSQTYTLKNRKCQGKRNQFRKWSSPLFATNVLPYGDMPWWFLHFGVKDELKLSVTFFSAFLLICALNKNASFTNYFISKTGNDRSKDIKRLSHTKGTTKHGQFSLTFLTELDLKKGRRIPQVTILFSS